MKAIDTSVKNKEKTKMPAAGFNIHPENINRAGRPPKGYSITAWFKQMLASKPEVKDAIGKSIVKKALEGDVAAQRMVWNYMDGMPKSGDKGGLTQINIGDMKVEYIEGSNE